MNWFAEMFIGLLFIFLSLCDTCFAIDAVLWDDYVSRFDRPPLYKSIA